jgi:hypothetical protein
VRRASPGLVDQGRRDGAVQPGAALPAAPPDGARRRLEPGTNDGWPLEDTPSGPSGPSQRPVGLTARSQIITGSARVAPASGKDFVSRPLYSRRFGPTSFPRALGQPQDPAQQPRGFSLSIRAHGRSRDSRSAPRERSQRTDARMLGARDSDRLPGDPARRRWS